MTEDLTVILTAFNLEYEAVRRKLVEPQVHRHDRGTLFEVGNLHDSTCRVALGLTGKGNHPAAVLAERAIQEFSPVAVLFVGVAGALWDATPLGDVVVATHVYAYHGGTNDDEGLKARPRVWEVAHEVSQLASHPSRTGDWTTDVPQGARTPRVHFGAIAAGEVVQNSRVSYEAKWIRQHYNDAMAIEMEAAGVAQAGHLNGSPVAVIRGISDTADGSKTSSGDNIWQPQAAANAAAFAARLAEELTNEREHIAMHERTNGNGTGTVNNYSSGSVGIQAAHVTHSTVRMGAEPPASTVTSLLAELNAFRDNLRREHSTGTLDDETYEAARVELDIASKALDTDTPADTSKSLLALRRLRGLTADVASLATAITSLIAAAKGLS
ncbi:5'-methylthioadenosine/S-adenosylhomocysteine nucleosidase [Haloechinothrix sp. YIM 98757]|uniref:5'-methylthioadenosine/S-adenosylhomocysteine nucleosidase n=1 Tax=Haloechinothrix aidingensis TaxID=2752311 RepID=A0A837ZZ67_9PSEU|nr:5'-methylthioadenosine/S-adenosylhomocysteine nucleosidase [Haloechinothrix aidingensis]MBA0125524.1 5'-methylthioadenosine/S-adenosylhomocysteine nucleosidase [Haloechinothrix aidingensis]